MKFEREFKEALEKEGFPKHWVESAIPYAQLKKCVKKVQQELQGFGLLPKTLAELAGQNSQEASAAATALATQRGSIPGFQYDFDSGATVVPKLTLFVQLEDGVAVDATLTPDTKRYLSDLASKQNGKRATSVGTTSYNDEYKSHEIDDSSNGHPGFRRIEVPLTFDAEFFDILHEDVTTLDNLQAQEEKALGTKIEALSTDLRTLARPPSKFQKSDMNRWRQLFDLYIEANVFFSTHELDHGSRNSTKAAQQLQWFQSEVVKRGIVEKFKLPESRRALVRFVEINISLLQTLKFQEINQKAISKILKKFDKRTNLGARKAFPKLIQSDGIMTSSMAISVCSQVNQDLLKLVPQVEDYRCPICMTLAWRPIRLRCSHILCIGCTIQLQRSRTNFCPLCRESVVMEANTDNIDKDLEGYLEKYFPKEVREKQIQYEIDDGKERFGSSYKHPSESKCLVM